jgi:hypothetical protein
MSIEVVNHQFASRFSLDGGKETPVDSPGSSKHRKTYVQGIENVNNHFGVTQNEKSK